MTCKNYIKFNFLYPEIKLYWNVVTHSHLCIIYGRIKSLQQKFYGQQSLKYLPSNPLQKKFAHAWFSTLWTQILVKFESFLTLCLS